MNRKLDLILSALIFLAVFGVYARCKGFSELDSTWAVPTAMSIIREGNINLDEYHELVTRMGAVREVNGHFYNFFPVGTSLVIAPVLFIVDQVSSRIFSFDLDQYIRQFYHSPVELYFASLVTAVTAIFIYLIARLSLKPGWSLLMTFIFAFCTSAWSVASRALWQHGPSMLMLSIALYLILRAEKTPQLVQFAGIPLALSYVIRPTNSVSVAVLSAFVLVRHRHFWVRYVLFSLLIAVPFFACNYTIYHALLPPYYQPARVGSNAHFAEALWGNLVSPARGVFVFSPVFLFSIVGGIVKATKRGCRLLDPFLLAIVILHWIAISSFGHWWGGHSYGPRFFSDMIPYFMYFLIAVVPALSGQQLGYRSAIGLVFSLTIAASCLIHLRGATDFRVQAWNASPVRVDAKPARLWDWHDVQFLRGIQVIDPLTAPVPKAHLWFVPHRTDFVFNNMLELKGYELSTGLGCVGCRSTLVLYWQALRPPDFDYSVFVHVIDSSGNMVAQDDHAPGQGLHYPPTAWRKGDVVADAHTITVSPRMASGTYRFEIGVYNWATGERMQVQHKDKRPNDSVILDQDWDLHMLPYVLYFPFASR